jgi:hypothetical protein
MTHGAGGVAFNAGPNRRVEVRRPQHASCILVRRLAALRRAHCLAGFDWKRADPAIRNTLRGIQRQYGRPQVQAAALATAKLTAWSRPAKPPDRPA